MALENNLVSGKYPSLKVTVPNPSRGTGQIGKARQEEESWLQRARGTLDPQLRACPPNCTGREIMDAFNKAFARASLPGEIRLRLNRTMAAIGCLRIRNPEDGKKPRTTKNEKSEG